LDLPVQVTQPGEAGFNGGRARFPSLGAGRPDHPVRPSLPGLAAGLIALVAPIDLPTRRPLRPRLRNFPTMFPKSRRGYRPSSCHGIVGNDGTRRCMTRGRAVVMGCLPSLPVRQFSYAPSALSYGSHALTATLIQS
jgi:hypothetical protein